MIHGDRASGAKASLGMARPYDARGPRGSVAPPAHAGLSARPQLEWRPETQAVGPVVAGRPGERPRLTVDRPQLPRRPAGALAQQVALLEHVAGQHRAGPPAPPLGRPRR